MFLLNCHDCGESSSNFSPIFIKEEINLHTDNCHSNLTSFFESKNIDSCEQSFIDDSDAKKQWIEQLVDCCQILIDCPKCGENIRNTSVSRHKKICGYESVFQCPICKITVTSKKLLVSHILCKHDIEKTDCKTKRYDSKVKDEPKWSTDSICKENEIIKNLKIDDIQSKIPMEQTFKCTLCDFEIRARDSGTS